MKKSLRMLTLIGIVVVISLLGVVSVWAGPAEQGTVPHPKVPPHPPSSPREPYVINGGMYRLPLSEIPPARPGSPGLTNVDGALVAVAGEPGESPATICFAHPRWPGFNYQIRFWDTNGSGGEGYFDPLGSWVGLPTTFAKGYYCATAVYPGIYALQGITHFPWATVK